ncbi:MAG: radical SAM-associated putative lipoprotein [Prevotellaceae bacterium]|jgi:putative lipoprotein (rSAM/lipoprotein system)|nr:radical SAM-associated putative lipoprotein [Prevotellaceae bacterium]
MKKINFSILKGFNALIVLLLGVFGFSCDFMSKKDYGSPEMDFIIKGKVVEKTAQKPIKNISIRYMWQNDGVFTDEQGNFALYKTRDYRIDKTIAVIATDIDGEENGEYLTDTVYVDMSDAQKTKKGDGEWYEGEFTKSVTIELTEK